MLPWLALACTPPPAPPSPLDAGWIGTIVAEPAQLGALLEEDRAGFIALHDSDLPAAIAAGGAPAARGHRALSLLYADLSRLAALTWEETYAAWSDRVGLPPGSGIPLVAALAALERGDADAAAGWLDRLDLSAPPEHALLAEQLRAGGLPAATAETALGTCIAAHLAVRAGAEAGSLSTCGQPLLEESTGRALYDPLLYGTLSAVHAREATAQAGLAEVVFSGRWSLDAPDPSLPESWAPPHADDPSAVRDRIRGLDVLLDGWRQGLADEAGLESELRLVDGYRSRALVDYGRRLLAAGQPAGAQAAGLMALDAGSGLQIGARNPAAVFVLLAESGLRLGRSREALDMLEPVLSLHPEVLGIDETLGDLVVLQGMARLGDSKEN